METVYVINWDLCPKLTIWMSDDDWKAEAKRQGTLFSLSEFEDAFNAEEINSATQSIRIL